MHGTNPIEPSTHREDGVLEVHSIFPTLQGEGPFAGVPALFIRLAGCNLRCTFCDTEFLERATWGLRELIYRVLDSLGPARLVVLTGGEPLRQNVGPFLTGLLTLDERVNVQIETAGNSWPMGLTALCEHGMMEEYVARSGLEEYVARRIGPKVVRGRIHFVCSPKLPNVHPRIREYCRDWKYIVRAGDAHEDGIPTSPTQMTAPGRWGKRYVYAPEPSPADTIWLQPCDEGDPERNAANMQEAVQRCLVYGHRLSIQQHKVAGLP